MFGMFDGDTDGVVGEVTAFYGSVVGGVEVDAFAVCIKDAVLYGGMACVLCLYPCFCSVDSTVSYGGMVCFD